MNAQYSRLSIALISTTISLHTLAEASSAPSAVGAAAEAGSSTLEPTQALIKGFSQYQAGRVESMVLDEFVSDLASEKIFQLFFPKTSDAVNDFSQVSGKRLIPLIQYFANEDINTMKRLSITLGSDKSCIGPLVGHLKNGRNISEFECHSDERSKKKETVDTGVKQFGLEESDSNVAAFDGASVLKSANVLESLASDRKKQSSLGGYDLQGGAKVAGQIEDPNAISTEKDIKVPKAVYVAEFLDLLQAAGVEQKEWFVDFEKLKSAAIFLASLSDASEKGDADAVESAIAEFVDEDQAYKNKRSPTGLIVHRKGGGNDRFFVFENSLFLASYFGIATVDGADSELEYRAFGPVGLEFTVASFNGEPLSINYSPIDIGAYVTYELKGEDYDPRVEDVTTPSLFFSYSFRNKPVAIMAGYQWGIKNNQGGEEDMAFFSVAFDLPIFTLF